MFELTAKRRGNQLRTQADSNKRGRAGHDKRAQFGKMFWVIVHGEAVSPRKNDAVIASWLQCGNAFMRYDVNRMVSQQFKQGSDVAGAVIHQGNAHGYS